MTNSMCRSECAARGFKYASTQAGTACSCSGEYGAGGESNACTTRCAGSPGERCGGVEAQSVYQSVNSNGERPRPPRDRFPPVQPPTQPPAVPPAPANGGQCVTDVSANGYTSHEVQRWEVSGPAVMNGAVRTFPLQWTTIGSGSHSGGGTTTTWTISANQLNGLSAQRLSSGTWLVQRTNSQLHPQGGTTGTVTTAGQSSTSFMAEAFEFQYPPMSAPGTVTTIHETRTFPLNGSSSFQKPGNASGQVACEWNVAL
jgi:hypothetical protein